MSSFLHACIAIPDFENLEIFDIGNLRNFLEFSSENLGNFPEISPKNLENFPLREIIIFDDEISKSSMIDVYHHRDLRCADEVSKSKILKHFNF